MLHPLNETLFLVNKDNAPFLAGNGPAVPQRYGDGGFDLAIAALMGGASLLLLVGIALFQIDLSGAAVVLIAAAIVGVLIFAGISLRSGWRSVRRAHAYRTRARRVDGTFTALELVDEGSGDWFLKGSYQFADEAGVIHQGTFAQFRYDLAGKPLPPTGTRAVILVLDSDQHTIL
ncbi:MAG: hypothetical protein HXY38_15510 [Chloroflexi bacterium]|nr:hypothetical protein [Chloroflexota bacterium]